MERPLSYDWCERSNSSMSYNFLRAAAELGIKRVSQASSIHAIGGFHNPGGPVFDYFPLDESVSTCGARVFVLLFL